MILKFNYFFNRLNIYCSEKAKIKIKKFLWDNKRKKKNLNLKENKSKKPTIN